MTADVSIAVAKPRVESLDVLKGALTLKFAFSHLAFFMAVPAFAIFSGWGRVLTFPALLFCFGMGSALSKRRKPAWPLYLIAFTHVASSLLNAYYVDAVVATRGDLVGNPTALQGGLWDRFLAIATLQTNAHYADFFAPYLVCLVAALAADRLRKPLWSWNPWLLIASSLAVHALGVALDSYGVRGVGSILWSGGYRSLQYVPVFAAGVVFANVAPSWIDSSRDRTWRTGVALAAKLIAVKLCMDGFDALRLAMGDEGDLWKQAGIESVVGGTILSILLLWATADVLILARGAATGFLKRVGKRAIASLCVQMLTMPLAGFAAIQFDAVPVRIAIGLGFWLVLAVLVANWDEVVGRLRTGARRFRSVSASG